MMHALMNHLWQSTLFAVAAGFLTLVLRKNGAHTRYGVWCAASYKFLVPFSLLGTLGGYLSWRSAPAAVVPPMLGQLVQPFSTGAVVVPAVPMSPASSGALNPIWIWMSIWACGTVTVSIYWMVRWLRICAVMRNAAPLLLDASLPVRSSKILVEPGVVGLFRPVLLLPDGISERLTSKQLQTILTHEMCHVRRRDNLTAAIHMLVEALFWFHPLVWWLGRRLIVERESACDEAVILAGGDRETYAEALLTVCKFYIESPLASAAGVAGADLGKRIERIMTPRVTQKISAVRKSLLAAVAMAAVLAPIVIGSTLTTTPRAATHTEEPTSPGFHTKVTSSAGPHSCNVTVPSNGIQPSDKDWGVGGSPGWEKAWKKSVASSYGNGKLWALLPPGGILEAVRDQQGNLLWQKSVWYRTVDGHLSISGRRLDGPGDFQTGPLEARVADGRDIGLLVTDLTLPSEGCWQVTGSAGESDLTFVVKVQAGQEAARVGGTVGAAQSEVPGDQCLGGWLVAIQQDSVSLLFNNKLREMRVAPDAEIWRRGVDLESIHQLVEGDEISLRCTRAAGGAVVASMVVAVEERDAVHIEPHHIVEYRVCGGRLVAVTKDTLSVKNDDGICVMHVNSDTEIWRGEYFPDTNALKLGDDVVARVTVAYPSGELTAEAVTANIGKFEGTIVAVHSDRIVVEDFDSARRGTILFDNHTAFDLDQGKLKKGATVMAIGLNLPHDTIRASTITVEK